MHEGHLHIAEILLKNEADVNYRNKVRALIPGTQVCIMWPNIKHGVIIGANCPGTSGTVRPCPVSRTKLAFWLKCPGIST